MDKDIPVEITSGDGETLFKGTTGDIHAAAQAAKKGMPKDVQKAIDDIAGETMRSHPEYLRVLETTDEFPIPPKSDFMDQQFLPAPDLKVVGEMLIDKYDDFAHLVNLGANVVYLWKEKGGETGGRATLGKCIKPSGLTDYFACQSETLSEGMTDKVDFIVWAAADHLRNNKANFRTICALVFHEIKHAWYDEKGNFTVQGHEFEGFAREIEEFGLWKRDIKLIAEACETVKDVQHGLFTNVATA